MTRKKPKFTIGKDWYYPVLEDAISRLEFPEEEFQKLRRSCLNIKKTMKTVVRRSINQGIEAVFADGMFPFMMDVGLEKTHFLIDVSASAALDWGDDIGAEFCLLELVKRELEDSDSRFDTEAESAVFWKLKAHQLRELAAHIDKTLIARENNP